jgi:hypothetical protein
MKAFLNSVTLLLCECGIRTTLLYLDWLWSFTTFLLYNSSNFLKLSEKKPFRKQRNGFKKIFDLSINCHHLLHP